jgi:hypothetical protein
VRNSKGKGKKGEDDDNKIFTGESLDAKICFGEARKHIEGWVEKAKIGYLALDVINPPLGTIWGRFNDRPLDQPQVEALVENYKSDLDNCSAATAMILAVKPEWLRNYQDRLPTVNGLTIDRVPLIELTPSGALAVEPDNLWVLSGNHRRRALQIHLEGMRTSLAETRAQAQGVRDKISESGISMELDASRTRLDEEVKQKEETISTTSRWAVELYNRGA